MYISIAMASYNGGKYLQRQLDSFIFQTRRPDELIICDDCSSDDTLGVLERFKSMAPFNVHIYQNDTNLGFTKNFQKALSKCSGDLIFLSDQDDIWFPEKIAVVTQFFCENPTVLLAIHDGRHVDDQLVSHGARTLSQVLAAYGSLDSVVTGALSVVRTELLAIALPIPAGVVGHDAWLHNIAKLIDARCVIDRELQLIVRHDSNTSDWIGSSVHKITRWDLWRNDYRTNAATSYSDRIRINEASQERLGRISEGDYGCSNEVLNQSKSNLRSELAALHTRELLVNSDWFSQKFISLRMLLRGDYHYFNGIRSFLRDLGR